MSPVHETQDVAHGYNDGDRNDPRTHAAAIANAFEKFGEKANYGEGILVVRIPPGPVRQRDDFHPGTNIRRKDFHPGAQITTYKSKEGNLQKALQWIGYIAAIAGAAALLATGFGAPAAAALLGTIAVTGGVIVATANIIDRARRGKLALDAELALDIISIISVVPAFAVARAALRLRYAARGLTLPTARRAASASRIHGAETSGKFLKIYGTFEVGSTVILVPIKLAQDIDRIENDPTLTRAQKDALIKQAELGALQSFLMLAGSAAATAAGNRKAAMRRTAELEEQQRQQMKLLELEGFGEYRSMAERAYFDAQGDLTPKALAEIEAIEPGARAKLLAEKTPAPEPAAETQPRPTEAQRPRPAASTKPPEPPDTGQPPATRQGPQAGEAESPSVPERIRMSRQEQARRAQVWPQDAETIEQGTRPDARAHARAADFTPMFRQWETLGVQGRKAHIEGLINAHLAREGIPPVKVDWGNQRPGDAEFNPSNWTITLSEKAVSPDQISHLDFAKLVDNAVHEGRHAATTFWGMRVALADHNYNPNTGVPGKILAEAIAANRRRSPSDELSPEALGEAREIYEVVFDQDQRRARLGAVGVLDRNAVLDRMRATVQHAHDAKALYQSKVDEVKRLEAEDKGSAAHAEALRNVADDYQAWMRAHREAVEAHNAYIAGDEETVSWRMGSAVQAPVLERLPLESRLANLRQQYERAVVEQARKRQGGDSKGADEALARSREAKLAMDKTQAELDSLVSKEPRLVGGRIAKHDLPLTNEQIANPPKAPDYVNPTTRGGSAVPPAPGLPKPPAPPAEPAAPAPARPVRPSGETPAPVKPTPPDAPVQPVPPRRTTQSGSLGGQRLGKILERTIEGTKLSGVAPGIDAGGAPSARPPSAVIAKTTPSPKAPTPDSRTVKGASPDRTIDNTPVTGKGVSPNRTIDNTPASSPPAGAMQPFTPPGQKRILKAEDYKVQNITAGANRWKRILTHKKKTNEIGLFKPERGEVPIQERTGIKAGQRYARTAAAAYLAEKAGIDTPEAEMVVFTDPKGPDPGLNEVGSFQKWTTEGDSASKYFNSLSKSDYETRINKSQPKLDLDAFDWVIANMDRHPGNWRVVLNPQTGKVQKVIAIDMDVSLPPGPQRYSGSGRWPHLQEALPPTISRGLYGKLVEIEKNWATHAKDLAEFIEPAAIQGAHTRLREVLQKVHAGTIKVVP